MTEKDCAVPESRPVCQQGYLSVKEAARVLGVSERSLYGYVESGRLPGERIEHLIMVREEDVQAFERRAPGRVRTITPRWRLPPEQNPMYLTTIIVRALPVGEELLERRLAELRATGKHRLPGTTRRYIGRNRDDPHEVIITLVWREAVMPQEQQCETALAALRADLSEVLDWSTAFVEEGQVLLHAG